MQSFNFAKYIFTIRGEKTLLLPKYKGSTLRGGFGHAFRRIVCVFRGKDCSDCLLKEQCIYSWVFETPIPKDTQILRKMTDAPHPFVIEPPIEEKRIYNSENELSFGLVLIGRAVDYLPYFIYAFEELGSIGIGQGKGKFKLLQVAEDNGDVIYRGDDKKLVDHNGIKKWTDIVDNSPSKVQLSFITPTRIKYENHLTKNLEFHVFFRNILRRISLLSYFHCGEKLDGDGFKELIEESKKVKTIHKSLSWQDWERYSNRQETRMKMGGFIGGITYEGDLGPFWSYIKLGEYVHIGKGSSFGLGRYEVTN